MLGLLAVPFVVASELIDAFMWLIPARLWKRMWRDVRSNEDAVATERGIRLAIVLALILTASAVAYLGWSVVA